MTSVSLNLHPKPTAVGELFLGNDVRTLIARQLGIDIKRVTDEAHFTDDLGMANWLDRLELMIAIEDQFAEVEMTEKDFDQIDVVGDLIRYVESMCPGRRCHATSFQWIRWTTSPLAARGREQSQKFIASKPSFNGEPGSRSAERNLAFSRIWDDPVPLAERCRRPSVRSRRCQCDAQCGVTTWRPIAKAGGRCAKTGDNI